MLQVLVKNSRKYVTYQGIALFTALTLCLLSTNVVAQQVLTKNKFIIYLFNKNNNQYSVNDSAAFLTQRALQRRVNQHINIAETDLPVSKPYIDSIIAKGAKILQTSKWFNFVCIEVVDSAQLNSVLKLPFVKSNKLVNRISFSEKDSIDKFTIENQTNRKNTNRTYSTETTTISAVTGINYGTSFKQINQIGGDALHNQNYLGQGMQIAVFDAGFPNVNTLIAFDSLRANNRLLGTYDFIAKKNDVYTAQGSSHGTNTLSCMAAWLQGQLVGTAPRASYYLFRTEDAATETPYEEVCWIAAAERADSLGVDIISSSLGYTQFNDTAQSYLPSDMNGNKALSTKGADMAATKGILVVSSAGNEGAKNWLINSAPADGDSVLSIGAVDEFGSIASFSGNGPSADGRIKPDVCAQGVAAIVANHSGGIQSSNGTSFSCPILAGMAACLWQAFPSFNNMQIADFIKKSASNYTQPNKTLGYGIPNFSSAYLLITNNKLSVTDSTITTAIYPVPFTNKLTIVYNAKDTENIKIVITDLAGKQLFDGMFWATTNAQNIYNIENLEHLSKGVYFVSVLNKKKNIFSKIVKY